MRELKSVLLIGPYPPPYGGIASHLQDFIPELKRQGYRTYIISNSKRQGLIQKDGLKVLKWHLKKKVYVLLDARNIFLNLKCFAMLKRYNLSIKQILREMVFINIIKNILAKENIALISFYDMVTGYSIPVLRKVLNVRIPIVLTIYANIYENLSYFQSRSELIKSMLNMSDKIVASSKYSTKSVELLGLDSSVIEPVYYGVDLNRFSPDVDRYKIRNEFELNLNDKVLLFVGRMKEEMGLDIILDVIPKILSRRDSIVLFIVGAKGELTKRAYDLQEKYKNRVYVKVAVPSDVLPYYYAACDILLAPTKGKHASMGMSIKEAMASGKPVIATNAPGIAEAVVNGETGLLVQTDEDFVLKSEAFCEAILNCLDSPELLRVMGTNARKRAEELFDKDMTSRKMIGIFKSLLEKKEC